MSPYFIVVEGQKGPKKPHSTLESVRAEAARLFDQHDGRMTVFILETCARLIGDAAQQIRQADKTKPDPDVIPRRRKDWQSRTPA